MSKFTWLNFRKSVSSIKEGETEAHQYLILELAETIDKVIGSSTYFDPNTGNRTQVCQVDVTEIRVSIDVIERHESEFKFEEDKDGNLTGPGAYAGNLFLDVSRADEVWLTDEKFRDFGNKAKKKEASTRYSELMKRYDRK